MVTCAYCGIVCDDNAELYWHYHDYHAERFDTDSVLREQFLGESRED